LDHGVHVVTEWYGLVRGGKGRVDQGAFFGLMSVLSSHFLSIV